MLIIFTRLAFSQEPSATTPDERGKIDLVPVGKEIYSQNCAICHENQSTSDIKSVLKIGPPLYGLLQKNPIRRTVFSNETLTETLTEISADENYIRTSLLDPTLHMATRKENGKIIAYPPGMPRFPLDGIEFKSIIAYLRTLNDPENRGPDELWVKAPKEDGKNAKFEIIIGQQTRIVRAEFANVSTRAIAVGNP
ncbi:c-type cytochrome [Luteolibacter algae]|uniref:C-type cytochrome n=1 Tax=Luteolibacter algae TaxID=454151 RepID=A0ABW5D536_9BACT